MARAWVRHGVLPSTIAGLPPGERALMRAAEKIADSEGKPQGPESQSKGSKGPGASKEDLGEVLRGGLK